MKKSIRIFLFTLLLLVSCGIWKGAEAKAAGTYMIKVNKQQNVVTIYKYKGGKYKPHKAFVCSVGYATPTGTYPLGEKLRWHLLDGPSYGQYCTRITGSILFHSVWYYSQDKNAQSYIQYNKLGTTASHGCVRLTVADAKWIYDNCPSGTKVVIYNSSKPGPLGKPSAIKVSGYSGWDPTDPDPANPYKKKKPEITGVEGRNIAYGDKVKLLKGVKVKNSTGFNAKKLLKLKIMYKMDAESTYKKVKEVNSKKPGKYKVTYEITDEINHKAKKTVIYKVLSSVEVSSITLSSKSKTLYLGGKASQKKYTLKVKKIKPASASAKKVEYKSDNSTIATVSQKGVIKAKKPGTVTITVKATDGSGTKATCRVKVCQYVTKLGLTAASTSLDVGNAMQLRTSVTPSNATNKKVKFTSSNTEIATVSDSGSVRALRPGKVTITAKATDGSGKKATFAIETHYLLDSADTPEQDPITVVSGAAWSVVEEQLPQSTKIKDRFGNEASASVKWDGSGYDGTTAGSYEAVGHIMLPKDWLGVPPDWRVKVLVQAAEADANGGQNE